MPGQRRLFALALLMLALEAGTAVAEAYPLAYLIDFLQGNRPLITWFGPTRNHTVLALSILIVGLAAVNSMCDSAAEILLARAGRQLGFNLRNALFAHLQRLSLAFHDRRRTGDVLARVTGDVDALEDFVIQSSSDVVGSLLTLVFTLAFLGARSWQMLLAAVAIVPLVSTVSHYFSKRIRRVARRLRLLDGDVASSAQEMLGSIRVIQTYGRAGYEERRFEDRNTERVAVAMRSAVLQAKFSFVVQLLQALVICAVVWLGLTLVDRRSISIGLLVMFVVLIQNMFKPTRKIIKEWGTIGKVLASSERVGELLDRRPTVTDHPGATSAESVGGVVRFDHVSFSYVPDVRPDGTDVDEPTRAVLDDVSIDIPAGQVLALIGHTGAGKSTVLQLLPRLYDVADGAVLIDGVDVRDITLDSLRSNISVVLQETILFSGTVAENIAYGRMDATAADIETAARLANAHEFVERLRDGYDTMLGERGANLSGGQRQRIAIARAYVRRAPILLLDEPTTGLDVESAAIVLDALHTLMRGKTTIVVSHDLKLIRHADQIVLLRLGRVEQQGTHASLLAVDGLYARLHAQNEGEPVGGEEESDEDDVARWTANTRQWSDRSLPTLAVAFDGDAMARRLAAGMIEPRYEVTTCVPGKATYLPDGSCTLRYDLRLRHRAASSEEAAVIVQARVFAEPHLAHAEQRDRVEPVAREADGHPLLRPFAHPVVVFDDLCMLAMAFPIDPELPTLVPTTDGHRMVAVLADAVERDGFTMREVRPQPGHCNFGRQHRCVVRYDIVGADPAGTPGHRVVYGKVADDHRGECTVEALDALNVFRDGNVRWADVRLPTVLVHRPDLGLTVLDEVAGTPSLSRAIRSMLRGEPEDPAGPTALDGIAQAARVAALVHATPTDISRARTIDDAVDELLDLLTVLSPMSESLALWLVDALEVARRALADGPAGPATLVHGDFTHTQLLFAGSSAGLIDFDTMCQSEPALDLGHFTAYVRLVAAKSVVSATSHADTLCDHFVEAYVTEVGSTDPTFDAELRRRALAYELISLVRIAGHSWYKLKNERLSLAIGLVREAVRRVSGHDPGFPAPDDDHR